MKRPYFNAAQRRMILHNPDVTSSVLMLAELARLRFYKQLHKSILKIFTKNKRVGN